MKPQHHCSIAKRSIAITLSIVLTLQPVFAYANPQSGVVSSGQASISQSGNTLDITQTSNKAVINWLGFDIAPGETTQFFQPSSGAIALNRVNSNSASQINGNLLANGNIIIINQNGVMFGAGSRVDVNGLVATTANISDNAFMNNTTGLFTFDQPGNPTATITNNGTITAAQAGLVGLVAPNVVNNGVITAKLGKVQLASGDTFTVDMYGDNLMSVAVSDQVKSQLVSNSGLIEADGGKVALTAAAGQNVINSLITVPGEILAPAVAQQNGEIVIYAEGSNAVPGNVAANKGQATGNSTVLVSGTLDASGSAPGQTGGNITVTGDHVGILSGANINASGDAGGGVVQIGGDFHGQGTTPTAEATVVQSGTTINANANTTGNGGNVAVWADDYTQFGGLIEARGGNRSGNGGFIETSGHVLDFAGTGSAAASNGIAGTWLLDPNNVTIDGNTTSNPSPFTATWTSTGTSDVLYTDLQSFLNAGTSVSITASGSITDAHSITTTTTGSPTLTLSAGTDIVINSSVAITASGIGSLNVVLDADTAAGGGAISMASGSSITTNGGNITMGGGALSGGLPSAAAVGDATNVTGITLDNATLNAGSGGNITLNGTGWSGSGNDHSGVAIYGGSKVETTSSGLITITGTAGSGTDYNYGVDISDTNTAVTAVNGTSGTAITINGTGAGTTYPNPGVDIQNHALVETTGSGAVNITGHGGAASGVGVEVDGGTVETTSTGNITITGYGDNYYGVYITGTSGNGSSLVTSTASGVSAGTITITGTGGTGSFQTGVDIGDDNGVSGGSITSVDGAISITGTGGVGSAGGNDGININTASSITASGGASVTLNGTGTGSGGNNNGVYIGSGSGTSTVSVSGGVLTITGNATTASDTGGNDYGVQLDTGGLVETTGNGKLNITGNGGTNDSGGTDYGIYISAGKVESTSTSVTPATQGTITLTGYGGGTGASANNYGVYVYGGTVSSVDGAMSITGTGGSGTTGSNIGIEVNSASQVTGTNSASITLNGNGAGTGGGNGGVEIDSGTVSVVNGNLSITGNGTTAADTSSYDDGVTLNTGAVVEVTGTGNISVIGTGGTNGTGGYNIGVNLSGGTVESTSTSVTPATQGTITITGYGEGTGTSSSNYGVEVYSVSVSSVDGAISITGTGGDQHRR